MVGFKNTLKEFGQRIKNTKGHAKNSLRLTKNRIKGYFKKKQSPTTSGTSSNFPIPLSNVQEPASLPRHLTTKNKNPISNNENPTNPWTTDELPSSPRHENNNKQTTIIELMKNKYYVSEVIKILKQYNTIPSNTENIEQYIQCINKQSYDNYDKIINTIYNCITTPKNISDDPIRNTYNNANEQAIKNYIIYALDDARFKIDYLHYNGGYKRKSITHRRQRKQRK